ncbi:MAG TPA: SPOR domain-containing protein [Clostridiales bacterium]|jgi:cell division protein FtsN|nr:SPOR domain-containing protein [Clostridiales bacterium]HQP69546.1 SPOR domain-containing protein [Clostridiales bacterium]
MRNFLLIAVAVSIFSFVLSSCAPSQGIKDSKYGPDDPSSKIVIEEDLSKRDMIDGYRIKVASVDTEKDALMIEKQIAESVQEPVYVEFIVDKYMIYAGDCQTKDEANLLKDKLTASGFDKIYSVPKKVYKKIPIAQDPAEDTTEPEATAVTAAESFNKVIGYRVQIFAAKEKANAEKIKSMASKEINERIYIVLAEDNLYKVQVGDYLSKIDAEKMKDQIKSLPNYSDAFVQNTYIYYDRSINSGDYYVQIGAFSTKESADEFIAKKLTDLGYTNASVFEDKNLFKVLVGGYKTNLEASEIKEKLKTDGFEGTWIIQK